MFVLQQFQQCDGDHSWSSHVLHSTSQENVEGNKISIHLIIFLFTKPYLRLYRQNTQLSLKKLHNLLPRREITETTEML